MAVTPETSSEILPPCLINPNKDCHLPCLNFRACSDIFAGAIARFGTTPEVPREQAREEGNNVEMR